MDVSQALKDAENSLRDFVAAFLKKELGEDWIEMCGVAPEKIQEWRDRKEEESKKQRGGVLEERLLYYAGFRDLENIITKNWDKGFSEVFGNKKKFELLLSMLGDLRNPEAHRREFLPHQKHLAIGISGEIRNLIIRYRSKEETPEDYFPRIESVRDSTGLLWVAGDMKLVNSNVFLHPDDDISIVVSASDPRGDTLEYCLLTGTYGLKESTAWQTSSEFNLRIGRQHVGKFEVIVYMRSPREYHALATFDDAVELNYTVLPPYS